MKKGFAIFTLIMLALTGTFFTVESMDGENFKELPFSFDNNGDILKGAFFKPNIKKDSYTVVIFIHGDGAMDRYSGYYFNILAEEFAKKGIACVSWDKKGVGESEGNWLYQNMKDRANETVDAIEALKKMEIVKKDAIILCGFSQGNWVLPLVASMSYYPDYMIMVSGAVNWNRQFKYMVENDMNQMEYSPELKKEILKKCDEFNGYFKSEKTYVEYVEYMKNLPAEVNLAISGDEKPSISSYDRWVFEKINSDSDSRPWLKNINCPVLALFGEKDENVDWKESISVYENEFVKNNNDDFTIKSYPDSDHSLYLKNPFEDEKMSKEAQFYSFIFNPYQYLNREYVMDMVNWLSNRLF